MSNQIYVLLQSRVINFLGLSLEVGLRLELGLGLRQKPSTEWFNCFQKLCTIPEN